jgi:hypothetical protein
MKHIKFFTEYIIEGVEENLRDIPMHLENIFYDRIKKLIDSGYSSYHPSVIRELDRFKEVNGGKLTDKIEGLL